MKQPDAITERDNLRRENGILRRNAETFARQYQDACFEVSGLRSRIAALEESLRVAQGERAQVAIKLANAVVVGYRAAKAGDVKAEEAGIELCDRLVEEYENLNLQSRVSSSLDNLDARAASKVGVWLEQGGDGEC